MIDLLPVDILFEISQFLTVSNIINLFSVNKNLYVYTKSRDRNIWNFILKKYFPKLEEILEYLEHIDNIYTKGYDFNIIRKNPEYAFNIIWNASVYMNILSDEPELLYNNFNLGKNIYIMNDKNARSDINRIIEKNKLKKQSIIRYNFNFNNSELLEEDLNHLYLDKNNIIQDGYDNFYGYVLLEYKQYNFKYRPIYEIIYMFNTIENIINEKIKKYLLEGKKIIKFIDIGLEGGLYVYGSIQTKYMFICVDCLIYDED